MNKKRSLIQIVVGFFVAFVGYGVVKSLPFLPAVVGGAGIAKLGKSVAGKAIGEVTGNINLAAQLFSLFLLIAILYLLVFGFVKTVVFFRNRRVKRLNRLLVDLHIGLVFFKDNNSFDKNERLIIDNTRKKTIELIKRELKLTFFRKTIGLRLALKIRKALDIMLENRIDIKDQITLVESWIRFLK